MNVPSLQRQFERIGAEIKVDTIAPSAVRDARTPARRLALNEGYGLDIIQERRMERYSLVVRADLAETLDFVALDVQARERHLLLMARHIDEHCVPLSNGKSKFLCGHDERRWFVAMPHKTASTVGEAMESLKPHGLSDLQHERKVRGKDWNRRKNAGFIRQGEWFFVPGRQFYLQDRVQILHNEPLRRGNSSKPHIVEFIYRVGGEEVYVSDSYPQGLTVAQYEQLLSRDPKARRMKWRATHRNPRVYAMGKVSHGDHTTITLNGWHQVLMNTEAIVTANGQIANTVAFID